MEAYDKTNLSNISLGCECCRPVYMSSSTKGNFKAILVKLRETCLPDINLELSR